MQYYFTINCSNRLWEAAGTFSQVQCASSFQPVTVPGVYKVTRLVVTRQHYAIIWVAVDYKHVAPVYPFSQRTEEVFPRLHTLLRKAILVLRSLFQDNLWPLRKEEFQRNTNRPQMAQICLQPPCEKTAPVVFKTLLDIWGAFCPLEWLSRVLSPGLLETLPQESCYHTGVSSQGLHEPL